VAGGSTTLTLEYSTATMSAGDSLQIFADSTTGSSANTVLSGSGAPASGTGSNGDFYIDTAATRIYGPKASGAWGSGTTLVGPTGAAATIAVGTVTTGAAGSSASVTNAGTSSAATFNFTIPRGDTGATGSAGPSGVANATAPITYNSSTQTVGISAATTSAAGSMSSADKTKLDGIASGATANSSDATLLARANHTGTQAASTITGLGSLATQSATLPSGAIVGTTDTQTLTAKTLGNLKETVYTITDGAAFEIDPANGPIQTITLGANRTPAATNFASGQSVKLKIDDGTAYAITWTTVGVVWIGQTAGASGTTPTLGTTGWTHVELWKESSIIYGALIGYSAT
jgi:hypothetical protein